MFIASLELDIHIPWAKSLKEKRMVLNSIKGKVKHRFNVGISEVDYKDLHQKSRLGIVTVAGDKNGANKVINEVLDYIYDNFEVEIINDLIEIF